MNNDFFVYLYVFVLSIFGGTAYNIRKIKEGILLRFSLSEWAGDIVISAFIGYLTFCFCQFYKMEMTISSVLIGISAHQGTRAIVLFEEIVFDYLKKR